MDSSLIHNGFNLQRRKQYQQNPRHNMNSSLDFVWRQSLDSYPMKRSELMKAEKQIDSQSFKDKYNQMMDSRMNNELKLTTKANTFRVMPAPQKDNNNNSNGYLFRRSYDPITGHPNNQDSLNRQMYNHDNTKKLPQQYQGQNSQYRNSQHGQFYPSSPYQNGPVQPIQERMSNSYHQDGDRSNVKHSQPAGYRGYSELNASKAMFGYDVNKVPENKNSYYSELLKSKLEPHLQREQRPSNSMPKHQSFSINHPVYMNY